MFKEETQTVQPTFDLVKVEMIHQEATAAAKVALQKFLAPLLNQRTGKVCGIVKFTRDRSFDLGGGAVPTAAILEKFPQLREFQEQFYQRDRRWRDLEPKPSLTRQEYHNRQALLTKVNNFWVKSVLEKSLYNQVIIEFWLEERPDAITNPWSVIIETDG